MEVKTGYLYHIKDKDILWFIPLSSKVDKYEKIVLQKIKKFGSCNTILIREILGRKHAILLQNAFPTLEKYIDHIHTFNGVPARVSDNLKEEILTSFKRLLRMKNRGINLFFTDIDKIKNQMLEELYIVE